MGDVVRQVLCTALEHGDQERFRLRRLESGILVVTPSVFNRVRLSRAQAAELRDVLADLLAS